MDELYTEILIKKKTRFSERTVKIIIYIIDLIVLLMGIFVFKPLVILFVVLIFVEIYNFPKLSQEYEYLYVTGSLDIDLIYGKQKRKRVCEFEFDQVEIIAPVNSHRLDNYKGGELEDYTSGYPDRRDFEIVQMAGRHIRRLRVEVNDMMINDLKRRMPNKVFFD